MTDLPMSNSDNIDNQEALAGEVEATKLEWRCFHCGDVFTSERCARLHFGRDEGATPACIIKGAEGGLLRALRDAEEQADEAIQAIHAESTDAAKAYHRQRTRHSQALIAAEESGYEKGLADGRTLPSNEALAGDDRSGVEAIDGRRLMELANEVVRAATNLCEDTDQTGTTSASSGDTIVYAVPIESSVRLNAALDALTEALPSNEQPVPARALDLVQDTLSRTPSSPQADEADVERVRLAIARRLRDEDSEDAKAFNRGLRAANAAVLATMTTRPAGVEEVAQVVAWLRSGDENDLIARRIADAIERGEHRAALTTLPKEGEEAIRAHALEDAARAAWHVLSATTLPVCAELIDEVEQAIRALSSLPVSGEVEVDRG